MPSKTFTPPSKTDMAVQWCIDARKLLKLSQFDRNRLDLKKRASANKDALKKVRQLLGDKEAQAFEDEFALIAKRIDTQAQAMNREQVEVEAERLNVLHKQMLMKLAAVAKNPAEAKKSAQSELDKALIGLKGKQADAKRKYETRLLEAQGKVNELRTIKYADATPVQTRINEAKAKVATVGSEDWAAGVDLLGAVTGLFETGKSKAEGWQAVDLLHTKQQPHYESKQRKLGEALTELLDVPGTDEWRDKVKRAQEAGTAALAKPSSGYPLDIALYDDGYKAITRLVPRASNLTKEALNAAAQRQRQTNKDTDIQKAEKSARDAANKLCVPGAELLDEDALDVHTTNIDKAVLLAGTPGKKEFGIKRLAEIEKTLTLLLGARQLVRDTCRDNLGQAEKAVAALLYAPTPDERDGLREPVGLVQAGRTLFAALEFKEANDILEPLILKLDGLVKASPRTPDKLKTRWEELARTDVPTARNNVKLMRPLLLKNKILGAGTTQAEARAQMFSDMLDRVERMATEEHNWSGAVQAMTGLCTDIQRELAREQLREKFVDERSSLMLPVTAEIERAQQAIDKLQVELGKQTGDTGNTLALAKEQLASAKQEWEEQASRAMNKDELDAGSAAERFAALAKRLAKQTASPQALGRAITAGRDDVANKAFQQLAGEVKEQLVTLRTLDADAFDLHGKACTEIGYSAFKEDLSAPGGPVEKMTTLKATVLQAISTTQTALGNAQRAAQTEYKLVQQQLKALRKQADESLRRRHRKLFAPFFDGLDQDLRDLNAMVTSGSVKTADAAVPELKKLAARALKLGNEIKATTKESSGELAQSMLDAPMLTGEEGEGIAELFNDDAFDAPQTTPNFRLVLEAVGHIEKLLKGRTLARCMPVHQAMLDEDLANLKKEIYEQPPEEAFEALRVFSVRVKDAVAKSETANGLRQQFTSDLLVVDGRFKELAGFKANTLWGKLKKKRKDPGAYIKELESRIESAKSTVKEPQKEQKALDALKKILEEINVVIDDTGELQPEEMVTQEKAAKDREFQQEKEATKWKALVLDFKNIDLARATQAVDNASGGDKSQIVDLQKMLKQAQDIFNDTGSFLGAVELLDNAKQYAQRVIEHPTGLKAAARNQLPKVKAHWKEAVAVFNGSVDEVVKTINTADDGIDVSGLFDEETDDGALAKKQLDEAIVKTRDLLSGLKTLFNPNIMDGPIAELTSKQAAAPAKRAARELAMKYVNNYRDVLRTDPVLLKLMQKDRPFGTVDFYGLNAALRDLDLNIQRAV